MVGWCLWSTAYVLIQSSRQREKERQTRGLVWPQSLLSVTHTPSQALLRLQLFWLVSLAGPFLCTTPWLLLFLYLSFVSLFPSCFNELTQGCEPRQPNSGCTNWRKWKLPHLPQPESAPTLEGGLLPRDCFLRQFVFPMPFSRDWFWPVCPPVIFLIKEGRSQPTSSVRILIFRYFEQFSLWEIPAIIFDSLENSVKCVCVCVWLQVICFLLVLCLHLY